MRSKPNATGSIKSDSKWTMTRKYRLLTRSEFVRYHPPKLVWERCLVMLTLNRKTRLSGLIGITGSQALVRGGLASRESLQSAHESNIQAMVEAVRPGRFL